MGRFTWLIERGPPNRMGALLSEVLPVDPKRKICVEAVSFDALPATVPQTWHGSNERT